MKRKLLIISLLLTVMLSCILFAACGDPDNDGGTVDKASQNEQFVSFRKKIVTILKDNDIFVNDLDKPTSKSSARASVVSQAAPLYASGNGVSSVGNILVKDEFAVDGEDYDFALKQIYAISLRMSLCIGDGLINYFDEKEIYNIPVYIPDMNMVITEQGNALSVYSYQYNDVEGNKYESFMRIDIVFNSETDYYFTVTETGGDWIGDNPVNNTYFYGNSQKQFLMLSSGYEVIYSPNGTDFYETMDGKVVSDCENAIGDVFSLDTAEYRKIKDRVKYRFTQEQFSALNDKYFKDVQSSTAPIESGVRYEELGGKQVAVGFIAGNGETEAVIPSDVKYISEQFYVDDIQDSVTSLVIPASIQMIIDSDGNELKDFRYFRLELMGREQGEKLFKNITVKQGSKLFKAGQGHLTMNDGYVLYALDKVMTDLDLDVLARAVEQQYSGYNYKSIFKISASNVTIDSAEINVVSQRYDCSLEYLLAAIDKVLENSNIETIGITVSPDFYQKDNDDSFGTGYMNITLNVKRDLTVNITFDASTPKDELSLYVDLVNKTSTKRSVTVNVTGFTYNTTLSVIPQQPTPPDKKDEFEIVDPLPFKHDDSLFTTFNFDVPEFYFNAFCEYGRFHRDEENSIVNFDKKMSEQYRGLSISDVDIWGDPHCTVHVTGDVRNGDTIVLSSTLFGMRIYQVNVDVSCLTGKNVTLSFVDVGDNYCSIEFYNSKDESSVRLVNPNFVVLCQYDLEHLKRQIRDYDYAENYEIEITLQGDDDTELLQTGWKYGGGRPEIVNHYVRFWFEGELLEVSYNRDDGVVILDESDSNCAYFAYPQRFSYGGSGYYDFNKLNVLDLFRNEKGQLCCDFDGIDKTYGEDDNTYILIKQNIGDVNVPLRDEMIGFEADLQVTFAAKVVDGNTHFTAVISGGELSHKDGGIRLNNGINGVSLFEFIEFDLVRDCYEYDEETGEDKFTHSEKGKMRVIFMGSYIYDTTQIVLLCDYMYFDRQFDIQIGNRTVTQTYRQYRDGQIEAYNIDEWGLDDVDNYLYYIMNAYYFNGGYYGHKGDKIGFSPLNIYRKDGSVFAQGSAFDGFLVRLPLGANTLKLNGNDYDLSIAMNIFLPEVREFEDGNIWVDYQNSSFTLSGTIHGREVRGSNCFPLPDIEYVDNNEYCKHSWTFEISSLDLKITDFLCKDKYVNIQFNIDDKSYGQSVVLGSRMVIPSQWVDWDLETYAYYWVAQGRILRDVTFDDGEAVFYVPKDSDSGYIPESLTLVRIAYGEHSYHLQDDDGQGNSYDVNVTFTVTMDETVSYPYPNVTISANGRYNEGVIKSASNETFLSQVSFVLESGVTTSLRRWIIEINGLDFEYLGIGESFY